MRGIPSCGKSTRAKELAGKDGVIVSADEYWYLINNADKPEEYSFDESKISLAHQYCFDNFVKCLEDGVKLVIVDNVNLVQVHMQKYIDKAKELDCSIRIEYPTSTWWKEIHQLLINRSPENEEALNEHAKKLADLSKKTHCVSEEVILSMMRFWQNDVII